MVYMQYIQNIRKIIFDRLLKKVARDILPLLNATFELNNALNGVSAAMTEFHRTIRKRALKREPNMLRRLLGVYSPSLYYEEIGKIWTNGEKK